MSVNIIETRGELTKAEIYALTLGDTLFLKDLDDETEIDVKKYCIFETEDMNTNELHEVLSLLATDGKVYSTISSVAMELFRSIAQIYADDESEIFTIIKRTGTTNKGRKFLKIALKV